MIRKVIRNEQGAAIVETAFALPILNMLIWMIVQAGLVFRAMAGIQHALGEGARAATLFPRPDKAVIEAKMNRAVFGIGPGDFDINVPDAPTDEAGGQYLDLEVTYRQETNLLLVPGPTVSVSRTKKVWVASDDE
jgi:hypothetical protein